MKKGKEVTKRKVDDSIGWRPYKAWREKLEKEKKPANSATLCRFARKMMAREWARALGRKREDPRIFALEQAAIALKRKPKS